MGRPYSNVGLSEGTDQGNLGTSLQLAETGAWKIPNPLRKAGLLDWTIYLPLANPCLVPPPPHLLLLKMIGTSWAAHTRAIVFIKACVYGSWCIHIGLLVTPEIHTCMIAKETPFWLWGSYL